MRTTLVISLTATLFISCGYRMFDNGYRVPMPAHTPAADSILTLNFGESVRLPDSRTVVSLIIAKAPRYAEYGYAPLLADTRAEAARLGGNLVKVEDYGGSGRKKLHSRVYLLNPADLSRLKDSMAAAFAAHRDSIRDIAFVHIKDCGFAGWKPIRFRDTLIGKIRTRTFGPGREDSKTFILYSGGVLSIGDKNFSVQKGKEYYVVLYLELVSRHTNAERLVLTDKTRFEHFPSSY
jgi:hypothetical protein